MSHIISFLRRKGASDAESDVFPTNGSVQYVNWARTAFRAVIEREDLQGSSMVLPALICQDSFQPIFQEYDITPLFVDVVPGTFHLDLEEAQAQLPDADAVLYVHAFGLPADLESFTEYCTQEDVLLIEDCARALGATVNGRVVGSFGEYAIYSLAKVAPIPKGGALFAKSPVSSDEFESPGFDPRSLFSVLPSRITDTVSPQYPHDIGKRRLDVLTKMAFRYHLDSQFQWDQERARQRAQKIRKGLKPEGFQFQQERAGRQYPVISMLPPCDRDDIAHYLSASNVPTKILWGHPWGKSVAGKQFETEFPVSARLSDELLHLDPLAIDDCDHLVGLLKCFLEEFGTPTAGRPQTSP